MYTSDAFADPKPTSIVDNNFTFSSASSFENLEDSFFNPSNFRDDAAVSFQQPLVPGLYNLVPRGWLKTLLGGLGNYPGLTFEIISAEEWDALQRTFKTCTDISARLCLDGENITWNVGVCMVCDPFNYSP
eukprot:gene28410-31677_t